MVNVARIGAARVIGRSPRSRLASTAWLLAGSSWGSGSARERSITEWPEAGCTQYIVASTPWGILA